MSKSYNQFGFTLAELLIALAILGVIATFTIPKVLSSQSDRKNVAIVKEAAATLSGAYSAYKLSNAPSGLTSFDDLTQYMNYVKVNTDATQVVDDVYNAGSTTCDVAICLQLHNGAIVWTDNGMEFGGTGNTNSLGWIVDIDPKTSRTTDAVGIILYYNGRLTSQGLALANTQNNLWNMGANDPARDPSWFAWN